MRLVARDRLSSVAGRLDRLRLVCVTAPAGSGKSTLMTQWHGMLAEGEAAWLSLERADREPANFAAALAAALKGRVPSLGAALQAILSSPEPVLLRRTVDHVLVELAMHDRRFVLMLDDAHHLIGSGAEEALARLIAQAPPSLTVVVGSRDRLSLPISRLLLSGSALEIGWDELRFTAGEAGILLNEAAGDGLGADIVDVVTRRTEGWATGLQLAAMTLRQRPDGADLRSLSGRSVDVANYLLEDVFSALAPSDRDFLMNTSVLDRFSAGLAEAVSGRDDARAIIERLEHGNLFLLRLDDRREWFRYHHLFQEFLQSRLDVAHPGRRDDLYRRAAHWCEAADLLREAMTYARRGRHMEHLADLLERAGRQMFRHGDFKSLRDWLAVLPPGTLQNRRELCVLAGWAHAYLGEIAAARTCAAMAASSLAPEDRATRAELAVMRTTFGVIQADEPESHDLPSNVVDHLPSDKPALLGFGHVAVGYTLRAEGRLDDALAAFERGIAITERPETALVNLLARFNIGALLVFMGRPASAEERLRQSLEVARARGWDESIGAGFLNVQLGIALREQNRLRDSIAALGRGIELLEAGEGYGYLGVGLAERARSHRAAGNGNAAAQDRDAARRLADERGITRVRFRVDLLDARTALGGGRLDEALACLEQLRSGLVPPSDDGGVLNEKYEIFLVQWCRLLHGQLRMAEVVRVAGLGVGSALAAGRHRNAVAFLVLQAAAWKGLGVPGKVRDKLVRALELVRGEGCVRPFLAAGTTLLDDLAELAGDRALAASVVPVLAALGRHSEATDIPIPVLRYRETQIIGLLTHGLRNREIGERLRISEETVKWYLKQLYEKLEVRSRTEAVQKAREYNLLA
ncbi:Serine/threonine-protein kinase PknK [Oceanibacterium hippocampi]|uniref:Serine/threonine-protein kinase PknK n=2 Tax=Oceanibacterium hippocampi TaxID=745714 RepID=A0A1Y5U4D0_9PROT|nr:Serine/threonine-protein kinase PknK [Oceanibacterium hippocampi]